MTDLLAAGGIILCQLLLFLTSLVIIKRSISRFLHLARLYFEAKPDGKASEFAELTSLLSKQLASDITASIKMSLLAQSSVAARQEKAATRQGISMSSPILGMLMGKFPGLGKTLADNPELAQLAISKLGSLQGVTHAPEGGQGGNNHSVDPFSVS